MFEESQIQDIQAHIDYLKKHDLWSKLDSFFCLWYPFRGSVQDHIAYLEIQKAKLQMKIDEQKNIQKVEEPKVESDEKTPV